MHELSEEAFQEGLCVDLIFKGDRPGFGDLFELAGRQNPNFPPSGNFPFSDLESLRFDQVDDYFGVPTTSDEGDDVAVWLHPLKNDGVVNHHPGPFDGLRVQYNALRNPERRFEHFVKVLELMSRTLSVELQYRSRGNVRLPAEQLIDQLRADLDTIRAHWETKGIQLGSDEALEVDF